MTNDSFTVICKSRKDDSLKLEFNLRSTSLMEANTGVKEIVRKMYPEFYKSSEGLFEWLILNRKN